jgi:hypothetical protein
VNSLRMTCENSETLSATSEENWKPVPFGPYGDYYEVSNLGRIKNKRTGKVLRPSKISDRWQRPNRSTEYLGVRLSVRQLKKTFKVHTLVLTAFVGPRPNGMQCCHGDCDSTNNRLSNLRWDTPKNNMADSASSGRCSKPVKLNRRIAEEVRSQRASGVPAKAIASNLSVNLSTIYHILSGRTWKYPISAIKEAA